MSPRASVRLTDVFLIVFLDDNAAQGNKINQDLGVHTILVSRIKLLLVSGFSWDLMTKIKI